LECELEAIDGADINVSAASTAAESKLSTLVMSTISEYLSSSSKSVESSRMLIISSKSASSSFTVGFVLITFVFVTTELGKSLSYVSLDFEPDEYLCAQLIPNACSLWYLSLRKLPFLSIFRCVHTQLYNYYR